VSYALHRRGMAMTDELSVDMTFGDVFRGGSR
jgi:hypothetical protein